MKTETKIPTEVPQIPGRGLCSPGATKQRLDYLREKNIVTSELEKSSLEPDVIRNNIENYVGSIEIPLGVAGPLLYVHDAVKEELFVPACTLEGALVASMSRGARAISASGGFTASVKWQKMLRAPLFVFAQKEDADVFCWFCKNSFAEIRDHARNWSNHAQLLSLEPVKIGKTVHLRFIYSTGDASGQNMTTSCTWHCMQFIMQKLKSLTGIVPQRCTIEGNGASDKKVSVMATNSGRGISVTASCLLREEVIRSILRTSSADMLECILYSQQIAAHDGMFTHNINVANALAAIFAATGQDLGSLHESCNANLKAEKAEEGLLISLELPNLVIGTVGGGTHLAKQNQALNMLQCAGSGKVERFAAIIAGAALGLEISTCAAITSGEFAKAHEKLGRNKPVQWLLKSELSPVFLNACLLPELRESFRVRLSHETEPDNGILTSLASRTSRKQIGFELLDLYPVSSALPGLRILLKSKAADSDVIKGLHTIAASIDPELSDLIRQFASQLEYSNCHLKEIWICEALSQVQFGHMPQFYGSMINSQREIFLLLQEFLEPAQMQNMNAECHPEQWSPDLIRQAITAISRFHRLWHDGTLQKNSKLLSIPASQPWHANKLYNKLLDLLCDESRDELQALQLHTLRDCSLDLQDSLPDIPRVLVHNDFNPRNAAADLRGKIYIYDWELAMLNIPQRDVMEFLCFTVPEDFSEELLMDYLRYHHGFWLKEVSSEETWVSGCLQALKEFIVCRASFYEVAGIAVKYEFSSRVMSTALRMLKMLTP